MGAKNTQRARPKGYFFLTPVWGEAYTRLFIETAIPAQLSPGNLPVFKDNPHSQYIIFTTPDDMVTIRAAPIFQRLSETIKVTIETITDSIIAPHDMMSACHKRGIVLADQADAAALFLNPDLVFADGSFQTVRRLAEEGKDVILIPGIRTFKQGVVQALHASFKSGDILVVPPRALMQTALNNLHAMADSSWWEEGESDLIPANLYWRAGTEGIVARCFHLHPLMVYPQRKGAVFFGTVDDDYVVAACPDDAHDYVVTNSDELLTIELSDPGRTMLTGFRKKSIDDTVVWAEQFTNTRHRQYFDAVVRMQAEIRDTKAWAEATRKAEKVARVIKARLAFSPWRLFFTNSPALPRRMIRWSRAHALQKANMEAPSPSAVAQETALLRLIKLRHLIKVACIVIPSKIFLKYHRLVRRIANSFTPIKRNIYGRPWHPYPWAWRYRYIRRLRHDMLSVLEDNSMPILVVAYDVKQSLALHCCGEKAQSGLFAHDNTGIKLIDRTSSQLVPSAHYHIIVIERALPQVRHIASAIRETARVLHPEGQLIVLTNRMASPADRLEYEICATTSAVASLLAPEFKILAQQKQGAFAQGVLHYILNWMKLQAPRTRLPFIVMFSISVITIPINITLALIGNVLTLLLDAIDTTGRCYISSITTAMKTEITP